MKTSPPQLHRPLKRPSGERFAVVSCPALRLALQQVADEWVPPLSNGTEADASVELPLMRLAVRLELTSGGSVDADGRADGPYESVDVPTDVRLLRAIRSRLLRQWRSKKLTVSPDRVLGWIDSIDMLTDELAPAVQQDLEARLAEPDAFQLLAEVAHDLRSPLTSILFLAEALRNGYSGSLTEPQKRQLGLIYSAAMGLAGVSNDLMTVAQGKNVQFDEPVAFSINETFEAVREMVAPMIEAKGIVFRSDVRCFGHRLGHPGPLTRVVLNLTTNAIKFTPEEREVEMLAVPVSRERVEISVRDAGKGMSPEQLERLFRPFQKSGGREGFFFNSSGLGLTIVRRLLERMDSELKIESEVGKGTRFSFLLDLPTSH